MSNETVPLSVTDLWEPWQPLEGQLVRIRLSAECPQSHDADIHGRLAVVEDVLDDDIFDEMEDDQGHESESDQERRTWRGHRYAVLFIPTRSGRPFSWESSLMVDGEWLAAVELNPVVPPRPREEDHRAG